MNELSYLQAILLGVIQGFTEFLPISSSGHLAITQQLMGLQADSQPLLIFNVASHVGTLVAVVLVFAGPIRLYFRSLMTEIGTGFAGPRTAWRIAGLAALAIIPVGVIGLSFKDAIEAAFGNSMGIGIALLLTGSLLYASGRFPRPRQGWKRFGLGAAFIVGCAQAVAILPGISRSGATICTAMMLGLRRRWAGQFSFLIAFPAICGATLLKLNDLRNMTAQQIANLPVGPIVLGSAIATIGGYFALRLLMIAVQRATLQHFCYYCWLTGLAVLLFMPGL